ncbi:MAG: TolB family protein, partial [Polyangiales bacterium]
LSALSDYDDWYTELVTHEYTHILHTDHITGLPAIYNAIFGKVYSPNQMQPRWILEGLAVLEESKFTSAGRERSSTFDMFLRADVLEDNIAPLDQVSHNPRRWPQGNLWYLYGSHFLQWIQDKYGADALKQVAEDYGQQIIPYGINRAIFRATGKTYIELYEDWKTFLADRYGKQKAAVEALGVREGRRVTTHGVNAYHPRYAPKTEAGTTRRIVYARGDGHLTDGLAALDLDAATSTWSRGPLLARTAGSASVNFLSNGDLLYDSIEVSRQVYFLWDLFRLPVASFGTTAVQGTRLTTGLRSTEPSVSPDGRQVVFTINGKGTTSLGIADVDVDGAGTLGPVRELLHSATYAQVYTPRWSPDGKTIVFSAWHKGGYRDIQTIDVATRAVKDITHDRALDTGPVYSPDGGTIYFSSDRTGIANLYAYDVATKALKQVTNLVNGAYQPDVSADGKHVAYVGYTHLGYDIFELDVDRGKWVDAPAYVDDRPPPSEPPPTLGLIPRDYDPLPTLRPHTWAIATQPDAFGQALSITTSSTDLVGHHAISVTGTLSLANGTPGIDASYSYQRLPFDIRAHGFRYVGMSGGYRFSDKTPTWVEQTIGGDVGISYPYSTSFWAHSFAASYSFEQRRPVDALPRTYDPYAQPNVFPQSGVLGAVHLG